MRSASKVELDAVSWKLLDVLQDDARASFSDLSRELNLSAPAVAERMRRLEATGVIERYTVQINRAVLGYPITAVVRASVGRARYDAFTEVVRDMPGVVECHHTTGPQDFILKIVGQSVEAMDDIIDRLSAYGTTETSVVLSSPVASKNVVKP